MIPSPTINRNPIAIHRQLGRSDRDDPYHFAGRRDELAWLSERLDEIMTTGNARGGLALVTGVPGSGKTTLCLEFMRRREGADGVETIHAGVSDLDSATGLFLTMGRAIGQEPEFEKMADVHTRTKGWRAGVPGVGADRDIVRKPGGFGRALRESASRGLWEGKALAIFFDEMQNVKPEQAETLQVLHEGAHGCPVMVIGAGLQHTRGVLSANGISRILAPVQIGRLDRESTLEAVAGALSELEIEPPTEIAERLAAASQDFPQHIYCYVAAAAKFVGAPVGWRDPNIVDKVLRDGDVQRADYYDARLEAMGGGHLRMFPVIAHMRRVGETALPKRKAEAVVTDTGDDDGKDAVAAAIRHGVLTVDKGFVSFGIPSFHSHMLELHDRHQLTMRPPSDRGCPTR